MELISNIKNKSIIILFLILVLFFFCFNCVNAQTFTDVNENEVEITDIPSEYQGKPFFISFYSNVYTLWVAVDSDAYYYIDSNYVCCTSKVDVYRLSGDTWNKIYYTGTLGVNKNFNCSIEHFVTSNVNLYNDSEKSSTYFSPLVLIIPQITVVEELPKTMTTVLKVLIPLGLIGCGLFCVILLTRYVILRTL